MGRIAASYVFVSPDREPLHDAYVELDADGRVVETGICEDVESEKEFHRGCAIMPGFVNSHCHVELSHLWKKFRKGTGMAGFIDQINALRDWADAETKTALAGKWMDIMWERGVSAMADISNDDSSFPVKAEHPMYTRTFLEVFGTEPQDCGKVIEEVKKLQEVADGYGIDAAPTPHSPYTMSPELLTASAALGLERGFVSFHSQESCEEDEMIAYGVGKMYENRRAAGMSTPPVTGKAALYYFLDRLQDAHPAPFDEHILLVHNVTLTEDAAEAALGMMKNVYWALCPLSNIFIHNALPPVRMMRSMGLNLTIGTDSLSSNDDYDMVAEMRCLQNNFPEIPLREIVGWATLGGARFLCAEEILGTLEAGKRPGIVLVDNINEKGRLTESSTSRRLC
ncbi:MAG: amidohydrolase family protein [Bacteroidales bacterium]|nr:amidohydrolase family protein [Bacteroidales bacterium]